MDCFNGYILAFAVLMVTCGRLADLYGGRKIFFIGLIIFAIASFIGGLSGNTGLLIIARIYQGAGAAFLWPSIVGICYSSGQRIAKGLCGWVGYRGCSYREWSGSFDWGVTNGVLILAMGFTF